MRSPLIGRCARILGASRSMIPSREFPLPTLGVLRFA